MTAPRCTTHHAACDCREAATRAALDASRAAAHHYERATDDAIEALGEHGSPGSSLAEAIREIVAALAAADLLAERCESTWVSGDRECEVCGAYLAVVAPWTPSPEPLPHEPTCPLAAYRAARGAR